MTVITIALIIVIIITIIIILNLIDNNLNHMTVATGRWLVVLQGRTTEEPRLPKISPVDDNDYDDDYDNDDDDDDDVDLFYVQGRTTEDPRLPKISPGNSNDNDDDCALFIIMTMFMVIIVMIIV